MSDTNDGSSPQAQDAPEDADEQGQVSTSFLSRLFGTSPDPTDKPDEHEDSDEVAAASREAQTMLINVRQMRDTRVEDVSVPRADIIGVADTATLDEIVTVFRSSTYTRLPVYSDTLDNPVGFVHLKDLALRYGFNGAGADFDLSALIRPLVYVPPSMRMGVLLQKMQNDRIHMALVIDEYGGVDGLVTIEDLVEQIVGQIDDEHDSAEADLWIEEKPGVYLCSARAPLAEFEAIAGVDLLSDELDEDIETLGGMVFMLAGRVPLRGEVIPDPQGHEFEVVDADPRMLKRVRVRLNEGAMLDKAAE